MNYSFLNLHVYSEYTFDYGVIKVEDYIKFGHDQGLSSLVITERFNLYSAIKFYNLSVKYGIKPIIGCEILLEDDFYNYSSVLFLCENNIGYKNLIKLLSKAYLENMSQGLPIIKKKWLINLSKGIIAIGLSFNSDIGIYLLNGRIKEAKKLLDFWNIIFKDRFYLSISRTNLLEEEKYIKSILEFSEYNKIFLVAINQVYFLSKNDYVIYRAKTDINKFSTNNVAEEINNLVLKEKYFKSLNEMVELFDDIPEAIINTIELNKRCNLILNFNSINTNKFNKRSYLDSSKYLYKISLNGLILKLDLKYKFKWKLYLTRLKSELKVITSTNFIDYFLVTYGFIKWAKMNNVLVGPGRGSGGGSLVAYSLSITDIDPIKYGLLFERFLNVERISNPDFDIDLCIESRDFVIENIFCKYDILHVAHIVTYGSMSAKAVIRDVGKILGYSYIFVDNIAKLIGSGVNVSLKTEIKNNDLLKIEYERSYEIRSIINLSLKLEGMVRSIGVHAGGIVISQYTNIVNIIPIVYDDLDNQIITQFDKDDIELLGLIKFDFLGLKTLTIIGTVVEYINICNKFIGRDLLDMNDIPLDDFRTYYLLQNSDTVGVFQLESIGIKNIIRRLKPDVFDDIVALVALYRPGPLQSGMLDDFINRKLGKENISYIHEALRSILKETYGVIVYQEQVMQIAQKLSNYSLGSADLLRSAMSKKNIIDMAKHLKIFIKGALSNNIDEEISKRIFYLIERFAGYGFNKSHSVGYALLSYYTAWLKANYTVIFMASLLSSDMDNANKLALYLNDCNRLNIKVYSPDINTSFYCFVVKDKISIIYGLGAIKGIGKAVIADILNDRNRYGRFLSFFDFFYRLGIKVVSKKTLTSLVHSGAFDKLFLSRRVLLDNINKITSMSNNFILYKNICIRYEKFNFLNFDQYNKYITILDLKKESILLSDYISKNPLNMYEFVNLLSSEFKNMCNFRDKYILLGLLLGIKYIYDNKYVIVYIKILSKIKSIIISEILYRKNKYILVRNELVVFVFDIKNNIPYKVFIMNITSFRLNFVKYIEITLDTIYISNLVLNKVFSCLYKYLSNQGCYVRIRYILNNQYRELPLNNKWTIQITDKVLKELISLECIYNVKFIY